MGSQSKIPSSSSSSAFNTVGGTVGGKKSAALMIQHLEVALKRGVDLLSVLGR